jgi:hypothetical protein
MEEVNAHKLLGRRARTACRESDSFAAGVTLGRWFGIVLPKGARADQVKADLRDSVLTVSVPVSKRPGKNDHGEGTKGKQNS